MIEISEYELLLYLCTLDVSEIGNTIKQTH